MVHCNRLYSGALQPSLRVVHRNHLYEWCTATISTSGALQPPLQWCTATISTSGAPQPSLRVVHRNHLYEWCTATISTVVRTVAISTHYQRAEGDSLFKKNLLSKPFVSVNVEGGDIEFKVVGRFVQSHSNIRRIAPVRLIIRILAPISQTYGVVSYKIKDSRSIKYTTQNLFP